MAQTILNGSMSVGLSPKRDPAVDRQHWQTGSPPLKPAATGEAKAEHLLTTKINTDKMLQCLEDKKYYPTATHHCLPNKILKFQ